MVYRGADAVSAWTKAGIDLLASQPAIAMLIGSGLALLWAANGGALARAHRRIADGDASAAVPASGPR